MGGQHPPKNDQGNTTGQIIMTKRSRTEQYNFVLQHCGCVRCNWCGVECSPPFPKTNHSATKDHVEPKSKNKVRTHRATVWSCRVCNEVKADLTKAQWTAFRSRFPNYKDFYQEPWLERMRTKFISGVKEDA